CCSRSPTVRAIPTRRSPRGATYLASSGAAFRRAQRIRRTRLSVRSAISPAQFAVGQHRLRQPQVPRPIPVQSFASHAATMSPSFRWELAKMNTCKTIRRARLGTAFTALAIAVASVSAVTPAVAQPTAARPSESLNLSQGTGTMVRLSDPMSDVFVADDAIADVQVRSSNQLYIFGKKTGETTVYATSKSGRVVYAANIRDGNNFSSVGEMLHLAMPEASIQATPMNNL